MRKTIIAILVAAAMPVAATASQSPVVVSAETCAQAISDAKEAMKTASVSNKARTAGNQIIELAVERCADKNYTAADQLLAIARGIFAEE